MATLYMSTMAQIATLISEGYTVEITVSSTHGSVAILVHVYYSPEVIDAYRYYVALGVPLGTSLPLDVVTSQAGWNQVIVSQVYIDETLDIDYYVAVFDQVVNDGLLPLLTYLTGATISGYSMSVTSGFDGKLAVIQVSYTAEAAEQTVLCTIRQVLWSETFDPTIGTLDGIFAYSPAPGSVGASMVSIAGPNLSSIAESLWAMALRDESISVNQNGPIWSAKGRMTTG